MIHLLVDSHGHGNSDRSCPGFLQSCSGLPATSSVTMPKFIVPGASRLTCSPVRAICLYCILTLLFSSSFVSRRLSHPAKAGYLAAAREAVLPGLASLHGLAAVDDHGVADDEGGRVRAQ